MKCLLSCFLLYIALSSCAQSTTTTLAWDDKTKGMVIDCIGERLLNNYVFPDTAARYSQSLKTHYKGGGYKGITNPTVFADSVSAQLMRVYPDKHLRVSYNPVFAQELEGPPSGVRPNMDNRGKETNYGFAKTTVLDNNIGYLKFNMFFQPTTASRAVVDKELQQLATVDALIVDLRDNGGGSPDMVQYISSYFFDSVVHLNSIYERTTNTTRHFKTKPRPTPSTLTKVPIYVLTSSYTFSGAEEFCYNLQNLKRATIIGERTGGGAHPVRPVVACNGFIVHVPFARAINPITGTNWEGVGIKPDIEVAAPKALEVARTRLTETLGKTKVM